MLEDMKGDNNGVTLVHKIEDEIAKSHNSPTLYNFKTKF